MKVLDEAAVADLLTPRDTYCAIEAIFVATARREVTTFPVVREAIGHEDALFGFKSGFDRTRGILGLKAGGYWPHNHRRSLSNHQSSILLFDPDTGRLMAVVGGNRITALRTAAACALSVAFLAPADAATLGVIGAGGQAREHIIAAMKVRPFSTVLMWNRTRDKVNEFADLGVAWAEREELCARSDVIVTLTSSSRPVLEGRWIREGTHIACMGTDTTGKQEVDPSILARSRLFTDDAKQSITIGECQHLPGAAPLLLGEVILDPGKGRTSREEITVYDGTGVGLQDLVVAELALRRSQATG